MVIHNRKGQSILEYAVLLAIVISVLLIMQNMVKRGYQGGLKDSSEKMGEQYSAGGTTIAQNRTMATDQKIIEEVATGALISPFTSASLAYTSDKGVYSLTQRTGGEQAMDTKVHTDSFEQEKVRLSEYSGVSETATNFAAPF